MRKIQFVARMFVLVSFCAFFAGYHYSRLQLVVLFTPVFILGVLFFIFPSWGKTVCSAWVDIVWYFIRVVVSFFLVIVYYLLVSPIAFILRLSKKQKISLKPDITTTSYWRDCS
jgi:hypothetical protein|tara:strand:- start:446 stop:787 length:342 start_codon:yes stop_codon:yes gene_type:complete